MKELDFTLYTGKNQGKTFTFTNSDNSIYNLTDSTVKLLLYITETPAEISGVITVPTGKILFNFSTVETATVGSFEYVIEETKLDTSKVILGRGNAVVKDYMPFTDTIESFIQIELPNNLTLTEDFRNQKSLYWKRFLQEAFRVADADLNDDTKWAVLQKALIAKLVIYDALLLCTRGSFIQFAGGDFTQEAGEAMGGPIKKIETGPSNVEFHSMADAIGKLFSANAQGVTPWDKLSEDICGLASKLKVKVPMCKNTDWVNPIVPSYYQNPDWAYPSFDDWDSVAGQGDFEDLNITLP